jgi:ferredoxin, 2Fe-2S
LTRTIVRYKERLSIVGLLCARNALISSGFSKNDEQIPTYGQPNTDEIMGKIRVIEANGTTHDIDAVEGWRVMEIIREHGFEVGGLCGGACACATCHVEIDDQWVAKLYSANDDEEAMLDEVTSLTPTSRLSCQIIYNEALDGLAVKLVANG